MFAIPLFLVALQDAGPEQRFRLENGLAVVLRQIPEHEAVAVVVGYRAGTLDDPEGRRGLAHLVSHLARHAALPSYAEDEAEKLLREEGFFRRPDTDSRAETIQDLTYFQTLQPSRNLETVLRIESERMGRAEFSEALLEDQRKEVLDEIRDSRADPIKTAYNALFAASYERSPYRFPMAGLEEDVGSITLEEARLFHRAHYRPDRAVLVLYGALPENARGLVEKHFAGIPRGSEGLPEPAEEPEEAAGSRTVLRGAPGLALLSFKSAAPGGAEKAAILLAVHEIRRRLELHPGVASDTVERSVSDDIRARGRSLVICSLLLAPGGDAERVVAGVLEVLEDVARLPPNEGRVRELAREVRADLLADHALRPRTLARDRDGYLLRLGEAARDRMWAALAGEDRVTNMADRVDQVTPEEIRAVLEKYFSKKRVNILIMRPE